MFRSTALDTVISKQVVVGTRPLKHKREALCSGGGADLRLDCHLIYRTLTLQEEYTDCESQRCVVYYSYILNIKVHEAGLVCVFYARKLPLCLHLPPTYYTAFTCATISGMNSPGI